MTRSRFPLIILVALLLGTAISSANVIINEVHYDPQNEASPAEFIELHNSGTTAVSLAGWSITDAIEYTFPAGTSIPAGGYLVIAQNPATINTVFGVSNALGPWTGKLKNDGEEIDLRNSSGAIIDQVDYKAGFPWPTGARGQGRSMELLSPTLDNNLGGSWRSSGTVFETDYIIESSTNWRFRKGTSEASSPTSAWRELSFSEDSSWQTTRTPVGFGDPGLNTTLSDMKGNYTSVFFRHTFNVDPANIPSKLLLRTYVDDGAIIWINGVEVRRIHLPTGNLAYNATASSHDVEWEEFTLFGAQTFLNAGQNIIAVQAFNSNIANSDFSFDVTLATVDSGTGNDGPTPGSINSSIAANAPPIIRQVNHTPQSPTSSDPVIVTAKVTDSDGLEKVTLEYQRVAPGNYIRTTDAAYQSTWTPITMVDNGSNGDTTANDSIFTATIPAFLHLHRHLYRYRIIAKDNLSSQQLVPYQDDEQRNFAYFVYDNFPSWSGVFEAGGTSTTFPSTMMGNLPTYHLIAKSSDVTNSQYNPSQKNSRYRATLVYDGRVYDNIEFKIRGEQSTYVSGKNKWRFYANPARKFRIRDNWGKRYDEDWTTINLQANATPWVPINRGMTGLDEAPTMRMHEVAGVLAPRTHYLSLRIIDESTETTAYQYNSDLWGLYLAIEQPNGSFLDERDFADGNIYKIENNGEGDRKEQGATHPTDNSDWNSFNTSSGSAQNVQWWRDNVDLPSYYTFRALNRLFGNVDLREGWNHYVYREPTEDKWYIMPWDFDMMFIPKTHWDGTVRQRNSINNHAVLAIEFRNRAREILDLVASDSSNNGGQIGQMIDEYLQLINPSGQSPTWADLDAHIWNEHPRTSDGSNVPGIGPTPPHRGNFFAPTFMYSFNGGSFTRTLSSADVEGFADYILKYTTNTFPGSSWAVNNGNPLGYGYEYVKSEANDPNIPNKPTLTYSGPADYSPDSLTFTSSSFSDPNGNATFGKMRYRIAQIAAPGLDGYITGSPRTYEIETVATSGDITPFTSSYTFPPTIATPGFTYRVRVQHEDSSGRTSHWSDPIQFTPTSLDPSLWANNLIITEVMYHPADQRPTSGETFTDKDDYEFIELKNISSTVTLDLSQLSFTDGILFDFATATQTSLAPGETIIIAKNTTAFEQRYGTSLPLIGQFASGNLSNRGETVTISLNQNTPVISFTYSDDPPWPTAADGDGVSLILNSLQAGQDLNNSTSWTTSSTFLGTPGVDESPTTGSGYDLWLTNHFSPTEIANPAITGPFADPDNDGAENLLEYALATDPNVPLNVYAHLTPGTTTSGGSTYSSLSYVRRQNAPDIQFVVEISNDLVNWRTGPTHITPVSTTDLANGTDLVVVRSNVTQTTATKEFYRIRVINTP